MSPMNRARSNTVCPALPGTSQSGVSARRRDAHRGPVRTGPRATWRESGASERMALVDVLGLVVLVFTGFTACAEFGSYAFVHPVVRRLPAAQMIAFEQGLLRTFGRAYPILMPLSGLMLVVYAGWPGGEGGPSMWRWLAVVAWAIATMTTLVVNVPINVATGKWDPDSPPEGWQRLRRRWELFQAVRAWLLLIAFALLSLSFATN